MRQLLLSLLTLLVLAAAAEAQVGRRPIPGRYPQPYPQPYPRDPYPRNDWVEIDRVTFRDSKTAVAIANCKASYNADARCTRLRDYQCGPCSEIAHSDSSTYVVYQLITNRPTPTVRREFMQTFHFRDSQTSEANRKCNIYREQTPHCRDLRNFECTPCTIESHTDHSQFELYRLTRY